jgi:membrane-associated phospholipid phosphatase
MAAYVSAARVQQRQHFLSDVMFGAALGIAAGRTVTWDHGGRRIVAGPVAVPGGAAMSISVGPR